MDLVWVVSVVCLRNAPLSFNTSITFEPYFLFFLAPKWTPNSKWPQTEHLSTCCNTSKGGKYNQFILLLEAVQPHSFTHKANMFFSLFYRTFKRSLIKKLSSLYNTHSIRQCKAIIVEESITKSFLLLSISLIDPLIGLKNTQNMLPPMSEKDKSHKGRMK